jgi:hypothetical protein
MIKIPLQRLILTTNASQCPTFYEVSNADKSKQEVVWDLVAVQLYFVGSPLPRFRSALRVTGEESKIEWTIT